MILHGLEELLQTVHYSDPAIVNTVIIDTDGMELTKLTKTHYAQRKDFMGPLVNAVMKMTDRFLTYLKRNPQDPEPFVLSWEFEQMTIFSAFSAFGTICVYAQKDCNPGYIKVILKRATREYGKLMRPVFT